MTRMLIIRPGAIGDNLLTFPLLQHLHTTLNNLSITFVGNATVLPLAHAFELAQEIADYEDPRWSELFLPPDPAPHFRRLASLLQNRERAIVWLRDPESIVVKNLHTAGIQHVIQAPGRPTFDLNNNPVQHHIVTYLFNTIGIDNPPDPLWHVPVGYQWQAPTSTHQYPRAVAIHPGSGGVQKCWPLTSFAQSILMLWQAQIPVLLLAGPAEHERLQELLHYLPAPASPQLLRICINTPLLTLSQELRACGAYIGNDSGVTHLAALLGLPTIALFGPTDPAHWHPIGPRTTILHAMPIGNLSVCVVLSHLASFSEYGNIVMR
jgi:heptosyltransferase-3